MNIAIIGGGAAGLMAGGFLSESHEVTIFDSNEKCGKKLYITGKGRCNVTNNCDIKGYLENVVSGEKFMMSAINRFTPQDTMNFFEEKGVMLKTERGGRVFPVSDKSSDIIKALTHHCKHCKIKLNEKIEEIKKDGELFKVFSKNKAYNFDRVIIATGGKSYPATGSMGDGYKFAEKFGHKIIKPRGALIPIKIKDKFCSDVEGLPLKNVTLKAVLDGKGKQLFGEMLFTYDAISGPIALSMSSYCGGMNKVELSLDFKPALSEGQLEARLLRDFNSNLNRNFSYVLKGLIPNRLVSEFARRLKVSEEKKVNSITKEERQALIKLLKNFTLEYNGLYPIESGIVTSGGVDLKEVNPKSMESKLAAGLYFIGEVLDVDCLTGGYNLQTAFSTAYSCATNLI